MHIASKTPADRGVDSMIHVESSHKAMIVKSEVAIPVRSFGQNNYLNSWTGVNSSLGIMNLRGKFRDPLDIKMRQNYQETKLSTTQIPTRRVDYQVLYVLGSRMSPSHCGNYAANS